MKEKSLLRIRIIEWYYYLSAGFMLLTGGYYLLFSGEVKQNIEGMKEMDTSVVLLIGVICLILGMLGAWLGNGIGKYKPQFRIVALIIGLLGFLWSVYGITFLSDSVSYLFLVINGYVIYTLKYDNTVLQYYQNS